MTASGTPATETLSDPFITWWAVEVLGMDWATSSWDTTYYAPVVHASIAHLLAGYNTIIGRPSTVANGAPTARAPNFNSTPDISQGWDVLAPQTKGSVRQVGCLRNRGIREIHSLYQTLWCTMNKDAYIHVHLMRACIYMCTSITLPTRFNISTYMASSGTCSSTRWPGSRWY